MSKVKTAFPTNIGVTREEDGDATYLSTHETKEHIEHGQKVAIYKLVEVAALKVTREVVRADGSVVSILD